MGENNDEGRIVELDVRPYLRKKLEPFEMIMDTVKTLDKKDTFILHATFKPTPLLGLLKMKGLVNQVKKLEKDHWVVTFVHKSMKHKLKSGELDLAQGQEQEQEQEEDDSPSDELTAVSEKQASQVYRLDNRGLEPPNPMMRTLSKLDQCNSGDQVIIHNDRVPMFLIEELKMLGYAYDVDRQSDGSAIVTITKK